MEEKKPRREGKGGLGLKNNVAICYKLCFEHIKIKLFLKQILEYKIVAHFINPTTMKKIEKEDTT